MNNDMMNFCISELALQGNPDPTAEEINQFYDNYLVEDDKERNNREVKKTYEAALRCGYLHTDGNVYNCTRDGVIDMALAAQLLNADPYEPVTMLTMDDKVVYLTALEFKTLAVCCGKYHYQLRQTYWASLQ